MRNYLLLLCLTILVLSCQPSVVEPEIKYTQEGNWPISTPEAQGLNTRIFDSVHLDITEGKYGLIDQFLVIRNGQVIYDQVYEQDYEMIAADYDTTNYQYNYDHPDWHPYYQNTNLHTLQSVTKSVTSALLGIAFDEGFFTDVKMPVSSLFNTYDFPLDDMKQQVTLEDLLTMRSGIEWDEDNYEDPNNSCTLLESSEDWIQFLLDLPLDTVPGDYFEYNSGNTVLLGKILQILTGKRIDAWAEEKLFAPLGIDEYYWKETPKGAIDTEGGLYLSTHDLAKIGYLFSQNGIWEGQQIISKEWITSSIQPIVEEVYQARGESVGYGYQWWLPKHQNGETQIFCGIGYGGQFLMVDRATDLVVVLNGWNIHQAPELSSARILQDRILPSLDSNAR